MASSSNTSVKAQFIANLGTLKQCNHRLNRMIVSNNFKMDELEKNNQQCQELLVSLLKDRRLLSKNDQQELRTNFVTARNESLRLMEISRRLFDDSLRALLELVKVCEENLEKRRPTTTTPRVL